MTRALTVHVWEDASRTRAEYEKVDTEEKCCCLKKLRMVEFLNVEICRNL